MGGKEIEQRWGGRDQLHMGTRKLLGMVDMSVILILVMFSHVYAYLKTYSMVYFKNIVY